jgi:NAD(P)-dependent dehydrogenase (short-subunit alcohol dehydrogenase family)
MKKAVLAVIAACVVLVVSAPASAESPSVYRSKANAICKAGVAKINAVPAPKSAAGYAAYFTTEGKLGLALVKRLAAYEPPASLKPLVGKALYLQSKVVGGIINLAAEMRKGGDPVKEYNAVKGTLTKWTKSADAAWRKAGLNACAG